MRTTSGGGSCSSTSSSSGFGDDLKDVFASSTASGSLSQPHQSGVDAPSPYDEPAGDDVLVTRTMLSLMQVAAVAAAAAAAEDDGGGDLAADGTSKRGGNMTERVPVPSSEHVAEIVGRQGCKIKALRNKTNTYIKTPVRGEEPVFVVTGRREDVDAAKREIVSAADHFTQIRAARRHNNSNNSGNGGNSGGGSGYRGYAAGQEHRGSGSDSRRRTPSPRTPTDRSPPAVIPAVSHHPPGGGGRFHQGHSNNQQQNYNHHHPQHQHQQQQQQQMSIGVRVPISMVGLVVGPKGATIKRIQQDTGTYIVTPGRDRDPVFEVIGSPSGVERARRQIEAYLETRIGTPAAASPTDADRPSTDWSGGFFDGFSPSTRRPPSTTPLTALNSLDYRNAVNRVLSLQNDQVLRHASEQQHQLLLPPPPPTPSASFQTRWTADDILASDRRPVVDADLISSMSLSDALLLQAANLCGGGHSLHTSGGSGLDSTGNGYSVDEVDDCTTSSSSSFYQNMLSSYHITAGPPTSWPSFPTACSSDDLAAESTFLRCRQSTFDVVPDFVRQCDAGWNVFAPSTPPDDLPDPRSSWQRSGGFVAGFDDDPLGLLTSLMAAADPHPFSSGGHGSYSCDSASPSSGTSPVESFSTG